MKAIPDIIKISSRELRKNMTETERILWSKLRAKKFLWLKFQRQSPIYVFTENSWLDRYIIPDFICFENKLIIELDWSIHNLKEIYELDLEKEKILIKLWYKVLRFKNDEIFKNIGEVLIKLKTIINSSLNSYSLQEQEAT